MIERYLTGTVKRRWLEDYVHRVVITQNAEED
jgi:hypothetical protein